VVHETPVIGFLKQFVNTANEHSINRFLSSLVLRTCVLETRESKCFDFAINYYPFEYSMSSQHVHSLYFFHFVKEQSS
jgi:hypothetical protein